MAGMLRHLGRGQHLRWASCIRWGEVLSPGHVSRDGRWTLCIIRLHWVAAALGPRWSWDPSSVWDESSWWSTWGKCASLAGCGHPPVAVGICPGQQIAFLCSDIQGLGNRHKRGLGQRISEGRSQGWSLLATLAAASVFGT